MVAMNALVVKKKPRRQKRRETAQQRCDRQRRKSKLYHVYMSIGDPPCNACRRAARDADHG
jgi:hypothetical protein